DGRSEVQQAPARLGSPLTGLDWSLAHHPAKARCRVRMQPRLRATLQPAPRPAFRCAIDENTGMTSPRLPWAGRLLALLCILLSAFNLRTAVTSLTPLLDSLGQTFGFGATMTGVFGMVPTAAFAVFGVLTPRLAHRIGLERTALLSMLLAAGGLLLRYFPDRVGTVSTLYITILQLGTMLPALAAVPLALAAGWRVSLGVWSLLAAAAVLSWLAVLWQERGHHGVLATIHDRAVAPGDEA